MPAGARVSRAVAAGAGSRSTPVLDARSRRIVRFALGTTLASAIAFLTGFELPFLVPILAAMLLGSPAPRPSLRSGGGFVLTIGVASVVGLIVTRLFVHFPPAFLLVAFLILFRLYYALWSGKSPFLVVWLLIASMLIPLIGLASMGLAIGIAKGITAGAAIAIGAVWLAHGLLPDPPPPMAPESASDTTSASAEGGETKALPPVEVRYRMAMTSTAVVFPVLVLIFSFNLTGGALILIFIALLSLQPSFAAGWKMGKGLIAGNVIGGLASIAIYEILVAYPAFTFFLLLMLLAGLVFGRVMFSDHPMAPLFKTGFNTVVLLVGMSIAITSTEAGSKFYERIVQIMVAVFYVVAAFGLIEWIQKRVRES